GKDRNRSCESDDGPGRLWVAACARLVAGEGNRPEDRSAPAGELATGYARRNHRAGTGEPSQRTSRPGELAPFASRSSPTNSSCVRLSVRFGKASPRPSWPRSTSQTLTAPSQLEARRRALRWNAR